MRVRVTMPTADAERLKVQIFEGAERVEDELNGVDDWVAVRLYHCAGHFSNDGAV